jgi:hypothetical protein
MSLLEETLSAIRPLDRACRGRVPEPVEPSLHGERASWEDGGHGRAVCRGYGELCAGYT